MFYCGVSLPIPPLSLNLSLSLSLFFFSFFLHLFLFLRSLILNFYLLPLSVFPYFRPDLLIVPFFRLFVHHLLSTSLHVSFLVFIDSSIFRNCRQLFSFVFVLLLCSGLFGFHDSRMFRLRVQLPRS